MVKFIDENLHRYSHIDSVKEAIQIRLHLNDINRDSRINTNAYNQTSTAPQLIGTRANSVLREQFPHLIMKIMLQIEIHLP